jgi:hypothetical protein
MHIHLHTCWSIIHTAYIHICAYKMLYMYVSICIWYVWACIVCIVCISMYMSICVCICMYGMYCIYCVYCMYMHVCVCIVNFVYICMYLYVLHVFVCTDITLISKYIHIHTIHAHTDICILEYTSALYVCVHMYSSNTCNMYSSIAAPIHANMLFSIHTHMHWQVHWWKLEHLKRIGFTDAPHDMLGALRQQSPMPSVLLLLCSEFLQKSLWCM